VAMTAALIVGLGAIVDPGALPVRDLPTLLGQCIDAAGRILEHPVRHWPRMAAAVLLVVVFLRVGWCWFSSFRDARSRLKLVDAIGHHVPSADFGGMDVLVVPGDEPFAFTVGLRRRRVVVSSPVLGEIGQDEREAVLAHERAHVRAWHAVLLTVGAVLSRSFPFIRPIRACADQLVVGLEMAADEAAARAVGDPIIVARALSALAPYAPRGTTGLGVAGTAIHDRVERLTKPVNSGSRLGRATATGLVLSTVTIASVLFLILPATAPALTGNGRILAIHAACHLPHPA
jgi:hypothetical protein